MFTLSIISSLGIGITLLSILAYANPIRIPEE